MNPLREFFNKGITRKIIVILIIVLFLVVTRSLINLFLLTFLFTYLMYSLQKLIINISEKYFKVNHLLITVLLYTIFLLIIIYSVYKYSPRVLHQFKSIIYEINNFELNPGKYEFHKYILSVTENIDITDYFHNGANYLIHFISNIGKWGFNIVVSLILSLFFMIEQRKIKAFMKSFKSSRVAWVYEYAEHIGRNFLNSFGKVIQAQIVISLINSMLSVVALGFMGFSKLLGLGVMIFVLGLVPVAGVFLSLIPLSIIAFEIGGVTKVVYVIIMIAVLHALESYLLNPKLMSDKTKLPVFFVFFILIVSEHFMGIWGLLIGIPMFIFLLDLMEVKIRED